MDVGVAGDDLSLAFLTELDGHNEALLGFIAMLKEIVHRHPKSLAPLLLHLYERV